ncbi:pol, partial [Symbiodinium microadriaticum]
VVENDHNPHGASVATATGTECLDILEVSWGEPVLSRAARLKGYSVGPAITHGGNAYSVQWDLLKSAALPDIGLRGGSDSTPMPLPDVKSGEDISPAERAKLDKEVEAYALEMEAFWKARADARDWDSVRANLEVYALAGEKVSEDPRRTEAYRDLVWEGLKIGPGPTRPGITAADIAAIKEVVRRKAAGFWAEGTT